MKSRESTGPTFHLRPQMLQEQFNLAARPEMSGIQDNGDVITVLDQVSIMFPKAFGRPLCEVNILVNGIPDYVAEEIQRNADSVLLRYMIAESLHPVVDVPQR